MNNYSYDVAWSESDGEYVATSAEFPGLSGLAPTAEEAVRELHQAIEAAVEAILADGEMLPEPRLLADYSGQFRLRIPKSQHSSLAVRAEKEGVSLNALVQTYIAAGLAGDQLAQRTCERLEVAVGQAVGRIVDSVPVASTTSITSASDFPLEFPLMLKQEGQSKKLPQLN